MKVIGNTSKDLVFKRFEPSPWQQGILDMINSTEHYHYYENMSFLNYVKEYRTFEARVPRRSGKSALISYLANHNPNHVAIFRASAFSKLCDNNIWHNAYIISTNKHFVFDADRRSAVLVDEIDVDIDISKAVAAPSFFILRLYT